MSWPGLPTWKMHTPTTYVVEADLRELPDRLALRYASQLQQWRKRDEKKKLRRKWLSSIQMAILAVHSLFRGLRDGEHGCGVQVSAEGWARRLGCKPRAVTKAFARLKKLGLLERYRRLVPHQWPDGKLQRSRADVRGISYLTDAGAKWLAEHAGKTRRLVVQSTWTGTVKRRVLVAAGLVGNLLETLRSKLKRLAMRLSPRSKVDRPEAEDRNEKLKTERRSAPRGRAAGSPLTTHPHPPLGAPRARMGTGSDSPETQRLRELFLAGRLTPWDAWPEFWGRPLKKFEPRTPRHHWAVRECEKWIARFEIETGATERRQPELLQRPDDPRPRALSDETVVRRRGPRKKCPDTTPATSNVNQHNWSEYE